MGRGEQSIGAVGAAVDPRVAELLAEHASAITAGRLLQRPLRILFVFAWLVVGGEETEVRLLAEHLPRDRYRIDVVACFRRDNMPEQTHDQLRAAGVDLDTTPYHLNFDDTITYLTGKMAGYDIVVSCQDVADVYPALERMHRRPALIEHGGLVSEALSGPKHFTHRYVGVCATIRDAAASKMPDRPGHALEIPSMVDLAPFDRADRSAARRALNIGDGRLVAGWLGRLDRKKRVEDFIEAAAIVARARPDIDFLVIGGPDAFMPEYADHLRALATERGLSHRLRFLGDRADVPELLSALDMFVWLSRGEGMPHVIAEAGAARLPVIATPDNGALEQISDGESGLFVPHESPADVARAMLALAANPANRERLGRALRAHVEASYSIAAVIPQWRALFDMAAATTNPPAPPPTLFPSFFLGGFECSSHRRHVDRARRDMIELTEHDVRADEDFALLRKHGIAAVRDGVRWHRIETEPGRYDFASVDAQLAAASRHGVTVLWDLLHYGWPDDLDPLGAAFVPRFVDFALETASYIAERTDGAPFFCPVNEISFLSWGGGDAGYLNPFARGRGHEFKVQLARAAIESTRAIRGAIPNARFVTCEPAIVVQHDPGRPRDAHYAQGHHQAQYQAVDMIAGRQWQQLGGAEELLDIVGINFYHNNQWIHAGPPIDWRDPHRRLFRDVLAEVYARYGRPIFVSETGIEATPRPDWLRYIGDEVAAARDLGVPVDGVCLYPVLGHLGWDDDRYCANGLIEWRPGERERTVDGPLAAELAQQQRRFRA